MLKEEYNRFMNKEAQEESKPNFDESYKDVVRYCEADVIASKEFLERLHNTES